MSNLQNLVPFTGIDDPRRHVSTGPKPKIADPEFALQVAEAFAAGASRQEMADMFDVTRQTITKWRRDPRVKVHAFKIIEDRVLQVTRKVDGAIAERLERCSEMTVTELLAVRKEFLGGALRARTEGIDEGTIGEAQDWLDKNPDAVEQLERMFAGKDPIPGVE
jgi:hypothetical protein